MEKKNYHCIIFIFLLYISACLGEQGILPGDGTEQSPYQIEDFYDFLEFINSDNAAVYWDSNVYSELKCTIDMDPTLPDRPAGFTGAVIAPDTDPYSLGCQGVAYEGVFNGGDHSLKNILFNQGQCLGVFGGIGANGQVGDLHIEQCIISFSYDGHWGGGLCALNNGTIKNCTCQASLTGNYSSNYGLFCGVNTGKIQNCRAKGSAVSLRRGLSCGGFCGVNSGGTIEYCNVTLYKEFNGHDRIGGFCGDNGPYNSTGGIIRNCYAIESTISGHNRVGGFCGHNSGVIEKSYVLMDEVIANEYFGGFVGSSFGFQYDCFYTGEPNDGMTTWLSGSQICQQSSFTNWDFVNVWMIREGCDSPRLQYQQPVPGDIAGKYRVDLHDFALLATAWMTKEGDAFWDIRCNLDNTGTSWNHIDEYDLKIMLSNWLCGI